MPITWSPSLQKGSYHPKSQVPAIRPTPQTTSLASPPVIFKSQIILRKTTQSKITDTPDRAKAAANGKPPQTGGVIDLTSATTASPKPGKE